MHKQHGFGTVGIGLIIVIALIIAFLFNTSVKHERQVKQEKISLDSHFASIKVPGGCSAAKNVYQEPNIDANSAWLVDYDCTASIETVYEQLRSDAVKNNQIISYESKHYDKPGGKMFSGDLTLISDGFQANYTFTDYDNEFGSDGSKSKPSVRLEFLKELPVPVDINNKPIPKPAH